MISREEIDRIFCGCKITYTTSKYPQGTTFLAGPASGHIGTAEAIDWHLSNSNKGFLNSFKITKIELTEENKRKFYEWIATHAD